MPVPDTREHKTDFDENLEQDRIPIHRPTRAQTKGVFKSVLLDERKLKKELRKSKIKTTPEIPVEKKRYERNPYEFYEGTQQEHKAKLK